MNDSQAWAAEQFSTSKSKERGMEELVLKSTVSEHHLRVTDNGKIDSVFQVWDEAPNSRNGSFRGVVISDADADRLEAWLRERKKPQPRRPDEVGVWECWIKGDDNYKWEASVEIKDGRLMYSPSKNCTVPLEIVAPNIVGVRIGDLPSEEPANDQQEDDTEPHINPTDLACAINDVRLATKDLLSAVKVLAELEAVKLPQIKSAKASLKSADKTLDRVYAALAPF